MPFSHCLKYVLILLFAVSIVSISVEPVIAGHEREEGFRYPTITEAYSPTPFKPQQYVVYRTVDDIKVDGSLNETSWSNADWTDKFGHILMTGYRQPFLATRAKMMWDDNYFYAAVELEEPNLRGHVITKDEEMYRDNDIELFIDVDNDSQDYIELEYNCLGTLWDMLLPKEYSRGGIPKSHPRIEGSLPYDVEGMLIAVRVDGSLNYPHDTDNNWIIEIALPWDSLQQTCRTGEKLNRDGSMMRINFSRVEWTWSKVWPIVDWKDRDPIGYDWTWSQQMAYNLHSCESYGRAILSDRTVIQLEDEALENAYQFVQPPRGKRKVKLGSMAKIKGGKYTVGPDATDTENSPRGSITVDDFYIDRYEVTIGEFAKFLNIGGQDEYFTIDMPNPDFCGIVKKADGLYEIVPGKEMYPMCLMTVAGAEAYAKWAGKRLPTEFEWEIAARGTKERLYPWGAESPDNERCNYDYIVGHTTPVGFYERGKTPDGVYDMAGNVWELCSGSWTQYAWEAEPENPRTSGRIIRGGSWITPEANMAATYRNGLKGQWTPMVGFRCARDVK